jgi:4-amino-4-deoxy-L-arabinose transferase-like glycosyltransferase
VGLGAILLLALGLRLFELTGQSLWYDEGVSAYMTPRSFAEIAVSTSVDIHPPLYYWLLSIWAVPFGQGEVALRGVSVLLGTLMVWTTWGLGRTLAGEAVGLAAAVLLAISPLAVQYSQEVRMYAQAGLLAAASSWAGLVLLRALLGEPASRRRLVLLAVGYGLLVAALLYTHYYGTLVVAAQQVYAGLVLLLTRRWRIVPYWALAVGIAALLFLPWLPIALRQTGYYPGLGAPRPAWALVLDSVNVLSIGIATTRFAFRAGLAPFLGLAALGTVSLALTPRPPLPCEGEGEPVGASLAAPACSESGAGEVSGGARETAGGASPAPTVSAGSPAAEESPKTPALLPSPLRWRGAGGGAFFLLLWLLLPIAGIVILSQSRPLYEPRFLMLVLPAWAILVGAGLVALGRGAGWLLDTRLGLPPLARQLVVVAVGVVVAGLLLIPTARSLASYYFDPAYARDNYRGLAETVTLREEPGDAVVLTAPGQIEIFRYYYRGRSDVFPLPLQRPIDPADTGARLEALRTDHQRVWLVRWAAEEADPNDLILGWLEGRGRRLGGEAFGRVELRLYDLNATARRAVPHDEVLSVTEIPRLRSQARSARDDRGESRARFEWDDRWDTETWSAWEGTAG